MREKRLIPFVLAVLLMSPAVVDAETTVSHVVVSSTYQCSVPLADEFYIYANATSGAFTVTLPSATSIRPEQKIYVMKTDSSGNAVTVTATNTANLPAPMINGSATDSLSAQYSKALYVPNPLLNAYFKF